jgi:uncharacterized protein (DUF302 family)
MAEGKHTMSYYFSKIVNAAFDEAIAKVTVELKEEGFGILTEIDVQETLKKKLNIDFMRYKILGACNPPYAYRALTAENKIGTMLPCNVIVQEISGGHVEVTAIDPLALMQAVENPALKEIAAEISNKLKTVIDRVNHPRGKPRGIKSAASTQAAQALARDRDGARYT